MVRAGSGLTPLLDRGVPRNLISQHAPGMRTLPTARAKVQSEQKAVAGALQRWPEGSLRVSSLQPRNPRDVAGRGDVSTQL